MLSDAYAMQLARVAIGAVVRQAVNGDNSFEVIERSSCEALLDVFTRYIRTIGMVSTAAARHAGRSESNYGDVRFGLDAVHADSALLLLDFVRGGLQEEALLQNVAEFPVLRRQAPTRPAGARHGARLSHVPDYMPPFPDPSTYLSTFSENEREQDRALAKKKRSRHKREAQDSLHALEQRMEGDPTLQRAAPVLTDGVQAASEGPPAMLHELSSSESRSQQSRAVGAVPPDALLPAQAPALQSSAVHECSGLRTQAVRPAARAAASGLRGFATTGPGSNTAGTKRSKQETILSLQHLHDLDEVGYGDEKP